MSIAFNEIPLDLRTPGVFAEFDSSRAVQGVSFAPHDALLIGQMLSTGSATEGVPVMVRSKSEAIALFGATSQLAQMAAAFKAQDPLTPLWAIPLDDASGTQATGSIDYTGTATEAGSIAHYIGGRRIVVPVSVGDTAADIETEALAQHALQLDLPVTVAASAGTGVDYTAVHDGTIGNQIGLGVCLQPGERVPAGLTAVVTAMSGGATDPDYATAVTAMSEDQYSTVACGAADNTNLGLVNTEMTSRWSALRSIEGVAFAARYGDQATMSTAGNAFNQQCFCFPVSSLNGLTPLPWEVAASTAALSARTAQIRPQSAMVGMALVNAYAPPRGASRYNQSERQTLLTDGCSTFKASSDGRMVIERLITTYQTNSLGFADTAYLDLYLVRVLAALRYSLRARVAQKFAGFSLAEDGNEVSGQDILTPAILRSELLVLFVEWQQLGWVTNYAQFESELLVEIDGSDPNRINVILPPDIINAFLVGAFQIQFKR
jgi:phage tail sheath gpL-like